MDIILRHRNKYIGFVLICLLTFLMGCDSQKEEKEESNDNYGIVDIDKENNMENEDDVWSSDENIGEESAESPYTYSISDINMLDGVFRLNEDSRTVTQVMGKLDSGRGIRICRYDGNKLDDWLGRGVAPTDINRINGEKLVLVGNEWSKMSQSQKEAGEIYINHLELLGYSNISMLSNMSRTEILDIQNIDISSFSEDEEAVNEALAGTGLHYHTYYVINDSYTSRDRLLTDQYMQEVTFSYYEGTQYSTLNIGMADPCYLGAGTITDDTPIVDIQQTKDGYFILDISELSPGLYSLESASGSYVINII